MKLSKSIFVLESLRVTLFCIGITLLFWLFGVADKTLLIVFNMSVMSAAATFLPQRKPSRFILAGSSTMVVAIIAGGISGFYWPALSKVFGVLLAGLAFYLPKRKANTNICVTSAVMFLIFSSLPFGLEDAFHYLLSGVVVVIGFTLVHKFLEGYFYPEQKVDLSALSENRLEMALIAVIALSVGWGCALLLRHYSDLTHLYWIALTILVVIQGSGHKTIKTSLLRILTNTVGALFIVVLFTYAMPAIFWLNLIVLVVFLFLIFALGFSYIARTFFIELFVLGFTHLWGHYHNVLAYDRILLTLIGGAIVILATFLMRFFFTTPCFTSKQ